MADNVSITVDNIGDVLVDLTNPNRGAVSVGKQWNIAIKAPAIKKLFCSFGIKITKKVLLSIKDIEYPDAWVVQNSLFSILYNGEEVLFPRTKHLSISLIALNTPFQIELNTHAILDCKEKQEVPSTKFPVSFTLFMTDDDGSTIWNQKVSFMVVFCEVKSQLEVILEPVNSSLTFDSNLKTDEKIAQINFRNIASLDYFPNVDCKAIFEVRDHLTGQRVNEIYVMDADDKSITVTDLSRNSNSVFNVCANVPLMGNPIGKDKRIYDITISTEYCHSNQQKSAYQLPNVVGSFTLNRNTTKPQLGVILVDGQGAKEEEIIVSDGDTYRLRQVQFSTESDWGYYSILKICNEANFGVPGSGVIIKGFRCIPRIEDDSTVISFSRGKNMEDVFGSRQELESIFLLESHVDNSVQSVTIGFRENDIKTLYSLQGRKRIYQTTITFDVCFSYYELDIPVNFANLPESQEKTFHTTIEMPLFLSPSTQWLGIDFGTSAIVCRYNAQDIDLRKKKRELFKSQEDTYEIGVPYLSSNVILHNNRIRLDGSELLRDYSTSSVPDYQGLAVTLSPTSSEEDRNLDYILPCIKMLVGYEYIPNITQYKEFKYRQLSKDKINIEENELYFIDQNGDIIYSDLSDVNTVLSEVYQELFTYYVKESIDNLNTMNNIVLTTPNTFSPNHYVQLGKLIDGCFREYNIRNLKFISESDAVACFYLNNWNQINLAPNVKRDEFEIEMLKIEESILVFDMGAGTLDITFMVRSGTKNITVNGRMGISKAGNYLDGVLAGLLAKRVKQLEKIVNPTEINDINRLKAARALKELIKNELKPALGTPGATIIIQEKTFGGIGVHMDFTISVDDLVKDEEFNKYIYSCTGEVLKNFFEFYHLCNDDGRVLLDTVIVSGRSSKLPQIRQELVKVLDGYVGEDNYNMIDMSTVLPSDKSKTVVVEGAMAFASRDDLTITANNIMANYGVLYMDSFGTLKYQELLNPQVENPINATVRDGLVIKQYQTMDVELDLSGCMNNDENRKLRLVQTYSTHTLEDWSKGNREYITEMSSYMIPAHIYKEKVKLHIEVDENNALWLYMNGSVSPSMPPTRIDVNSELNKKSMWPVKAQMQKL